MIENGYTEKLHIKYSELDRNKVLKPFALLNFLQDIASAHADTTGLGYSYLYPKNYMWFVLKYHMEFNEYPSGTNNFIIKTEPRGYNRLFVYRDYEFWENEKNIGRATSMWAIIDADTHAMAKPEIVIPNNPRIVPHIKRDDDLEFTKISSINRVDLEEVFKVRYNDLDVNGHANNGNYIVWAFEPLSAEFRTNHRIKTLDIVYKKEAKLGENLIVQIEYKNELTTTHVLKNVAGEELCLVQCNWI